MNRDLGAVRVRVRVHAVCAVGHARMAEGDTRKAWAQSQRAKGNMHGVVVSHAGTAAALPKEAPM